MTLLGGIMVGAGIVGMIFKGTTEAMKMAYTYTALRKANKADQKAKK